MVERDSHPGHYLCSVLSQAAGVAAPQWAGPRLSPTPSPPLSHLLTPQQKSALLEVTYSQERGQMTTFGPSLPKWRLGKSPRSN